MQFDESSFEHYGINTTDAAAGLVARSRRIAGFNEEEAREIAVDETRRARR